MTPAENLIRHYRWLRHYGINDAHSGNMSIRCGTRVWITPTGACADTLGSEQLMIAPASGPPPPGSSLDAGLHLAVYAATATHAAVIHSHGPYSVAMTFDGHDYVPADFEGQLYFPRVPVLTIAFDRYVADSVVQVAQLLRDFPVVVVRGHGVYAAAESLELAYKWTCSLEHSAKTSYLARRAGTL